MTVVGLKELVKEAPDKMEVLIATDEVHFSPIMDFLGVATFPTEQSDEIDYTVIVLNSDEDLEFREETK